MNKAEIAELLRREVGELEVSIQKVQARCERLKRFVLDLEQEITPPPPPEKPPGKFREIVDQVFGETPKRKR